MMDWYFLMGESDLMITLPATQKSIHLWNDGGPGLKTATIMPVYNGETCLKMQVVQPDDYHYLEDYNK
jgi:hypothetical protein